ncbi:spore coat protein [Ammoniphilus sp. CFH 90114]|uniref:spore coat protein n=1 Tax=Ammoniphilus sp. CFH 90114 TaxID=2493665 RepID=UPI00100E3245|nr:spore coat protein [Ammoniphilus sp. CFH 90114]RXT06975.1 spore coat protein [Ammoniphilus sp. CFH 90114]
MYQQESFTYNKPVLPEKDLAYSILADLKRIVREYTTAATESNCPMVRQMFNNLVQDTLMMQGQLYTVMKQQNMYGTSTQALRQEIDKQYRNYQNTQQQTQQLLQQHLGRLPMQTSTPSPTMQYQGNPFQM